MQQHTFLVLFGCIALVGIALLLFYRTNSKTKPGLNTPYLDQYQLIGKMWSQANEEKWKVIDILNSGFINGKWANVILSSVMRRITFYKNLHTLIRKRREALSPEELRVYFEAYYPLTFEDAFLEPDEEFEKYFAGFPDEYPDNHFYNRPPYNSKTDTGRIQTDKPNNSNEPKSRIETLGDALIRLKDNALRTELLEEIKGFLIEMPDQELDAMILSVLIQKVEKSPSPQIKAMKATYSNLSTAINHINQGATEKEKLNIPTLQAWNRQFRDQQKNNIHRIPMEEIDNRIGMQVDRSDWINSDEAKEERQRLSDMIAPKPKDEPVDAPEQLPQEGTENNEDEITINNPVYQPSKEAKNTMAELNDQLQQSQGRNKIQDDIEKLMDRESANQSLWMDRNIIH